MDIAYRPIVRADRDGILTITDVCINAEEAYHAYIGEMLERLDGGTAGVLALDGDRPVGISLCVKGMELTGGRQDFFPQIRADTGNEEIWSGAVVAVLDAYRGLHIGSELQRRSFHEIRKRGGSHLLLEIWVHPDGAEPSRSSLKLAPSFTDYGVVPDFYQIPALEGHVCQICGTPCHCGARIAVLHLYPEVTYRFARRDDLQKVLELSSKYIDISDQYRAYIASLHDSLGTASMELLAFSGGQLIGLLSVREGMHLTGERTDCFDQILRDIDGAKIWSNVFIVVDPAFQTYRIAVELTNRMRDALLLMGVGYLLCEIWCRPDGYMPSRGLLKYNGPSFREYAMVEHFYRDIPGMEGVKCQVCGENCQCKALIAVASLT